MFNNLYNKNRYTNVMRLKKEKKNKNEMIAARVSKQQLNKIKINANLYTDGNISEWILYASINCKPKKKDIEN